MIEKFSDLRKLFYFFFVVIGIINLFVFSPSLSHPERGDHLTYLMETSKREHLLDLLQFSYSYSRTRQIESGDQQLFRPLFYSLMAIEKWAFRYNFYYWQLTSLILHLMVLFQMLRIFYLFKPGIMAGFFVLGFSVWRLGNELVIWHHINGNLLFIIFFLQAFYHYVKYIFSNQKQRKDLWAMVFFMGVGCFVLEFGFFCCFIFMASLLIHRFWFLPKDSFPKGSSSKNTPGLFLIPMFLYAISNFLDYFTRFGFRNFEKISTLSTSLISGFKLFAGMLWQGLCFPVFVFIVTPSRSRFVPLSQIIGYKPGFGAELLMLFQSSIKDLCAFLNLLYLVFFIFGLGLMVYLLLKDRKNFSRIQAVSGVGRPQGLKFIFGVTLVISITYLTAVIWRAYLARGELFILENLHYYYFFGLFMMISFFIAWVVMSERSTTAMKVAGFLLMATLSLSTVVNGQLAYVANQEISARFAPLQKYIVGLDHFVNQHRREKNFSFSIFWSDLYYSVEYRVGRQKKVIKGEVAQLLFDSYISSDSPKYYLIYQEKEGWQSFKTQSLASEYLAKLTMANGNLPEPCIFVRNFY